MAKKKSEKKIVGSMLRKLTSKAIMEGKIEKPGEDEEVHLYTIFGIATSADVRESTYGPATRFMGQFEAHRSEDRKAFRAPTCYLPEPLSSMVKSALAERKTDENGNVTPVKFGAEVWIVPADNKAGYEYRTVPVTAPEASNEMDELRQLALAGPKG